MDQTLDAIASSFRFYARLRAHLLFASQGLSMRVCWPRRIASPESSPGIFFHRISQRQKAVERSKPSTLSATWDEGCIAKSSVSSYAVEHSVRIVGTRAGSGGFMRPGDSHDRWLSAICQWTHLWPNRRGSAPMTLLES